MTTLTVEEHIKACLEMNRASMTFPVGHQFYTADMPYTPFEIIGLKPNGMLWNYVVSHRDRHWSVMCHERVMTTALAVNPNTLDEHTFIVCPTNSPDIVRIIGRMFAADFCFLGDTQTKCTTVVRSEMSSNWVITHDDPRVNKMRQLAYGYFSQHCNRLASSKDFVQVAPYCINTQ